MNYFLCEIFLPCYRKIVVNVKWLVMDWSSVSALVWSSVVDRAQNTIIIIVVVINPLTTRIVGAPQMISQPISSIFLCFPLPFGTWRTPGLFIPWCLPTTILFSQTANKQGNPSFHIHALGSKRGYPCTHTLEQHWLFQNVFFPLFQFSTGWCIWHASWAWKQKMGEKQLPHCKKCPKTSNTFSLLLDNSYNLTWKLSYSLTCWQTSTKNRELLQRS